MKMKRRHLFIGITSLLITAIIVFLVRTYTYKYDVIIKSEIRNHSEVMLYHDLKHDGNYSQFRLYNCDRLGGHTIVIFEGLTTIIREQLIFNYLIHPEDVIFRDWTEDGIDDLIVFSHSEEGTHLTVYDIAREHLVFNEKFFYDIADCANRKPWVPGEFFDLQFFTDPDDGKRKCLVQVNGAFNFRCRSLLVLDINTLETQYEFSNTAGFYKLFVINDNDGRFKKIISIATPHGNDGEKYPYSDYYAWVFILNNKLELIREPYNLARYTGGITAVFNENDSFIIGTYRNDSFSTETKIFSLMPDNSLRVMFSDSIFFDSGFIKLQTEGRPHYLFAGKNKIMVLDSAYRTVTKDSSLQFASLWSLTDNIGFLLNDPEIIFIDGNAEVIAKISDKRIDKLHTPENRYNTSKSSSDEFPYFHFYNNRNLITLSLSTNYFYSYIFLIAPAFFFVLNLGIRGSFYLFIRFFLDYRTKQRLINSNANGILLLDEKLRIKYLNDNFIDTLRFENKSYRKKKYDELLDRFSPVYMIIKNSIGSESIISDNISWVKDEKEFSGRIIITPFRFYSDYIIGYLIELINFTEPVSAERIKAWSKTSQKIAHDIKTPLSTIQLNVSALQQRIENSDLENKFEYLDDLYYISKETRRISNLTRNFLQLSNLNKPVKKLIAVEELIQFSLQRFQSYFKSGISLNLQLESPEEVLFCDPTQMEQVLEALIENAIEALGSKGGEIKIESGKADGKYWIRVADTGPGIKHENLEKIFEPYFSTKSEGTGLGLIIAKNIIEEHNGTISVESSGGNGTSFKISLPRMEKNE